MVTKRQTKIIKQLYYGNSTGTKLKKKIGMYKSDISKVIKELEDKDIVELKEERPGKRGGREKVYGLTGYGKILALTLDKSRVDRIEHEINSLKKKLLRPPDVDEILMEIGEDPKNEHYRGLVHKVLRFLKEDWHFPNEEEKKESFNKMVNCILWGGWIAKDYHNQNLWREWWDNGIEKVRVIGIGSDFLTLVRGELGEILSNYKKVPETIHIGVSGERRERESYLNLEEIEKYSKRSPEMLVEIEKKAEDKMIIYEFKWSDDAKRLISIISKERPWKASFELSNLMRRINKEEYRKYKKLMEEKPRKRKLFLGKIRELVKDAGPDEEVLKDILKWLDRLEEFRPKILNILRLYCNNAKEVGLLPNDKVALKLGKIAFDEKIEETFREEAFNIIETLDARVLEEKAKEYCLKVVEKGYKSGSYLPRVGRWVNRNPEIKEELRMKVEKIIIKSNDEDVIDSCESFIRLCF
jgi:DNA-binding MarR family transcriptional regulator